ncbi:c-type cytochrome [Verrucomicrobiaceae bacterium 5K15]|uniref:C-type cytochrome n=1 Tax=Oceaniferula flava TaxID=2800421 RepID=A0AAE2S989_9BACT|nr:c-type cytochrome [Oceaniferula flavus]MBK1854028.1 c-type cytochrome [Oceaniferula flavus]MBM1135334.1 c-type cytochrome [Oceaniferula flavus]
MTRPPFINSLLRSSLLTGIVATATGSLFANPPELDITKYADSDVTPSPACLSAAPNGDVYVGVDLLGSLGKGSGKGSIVKLVDTDNDGKADKHTVFAKVDNPRGLFAVGDKLYVLHTVIPPGKKMTGMHLSVFTDADGDGKADGPAKRLVKNVSTLKSNQKRGADHTTNGIRMGIDGWIYIAVGDFGFVGAEGTDGKKITQLGGGILRVRPDGTEMEVYTHGLRNIYDVAIDPFMNIFTRGNTNDGGGWNVRFIHQIQSGEYGYPVLFKHFTHEAIPALKDLGGGSGTGALFFQEPGWPEKYNNVPMMADWGRNHLYIHRITPDGPTYTQQAEDFIQSPQISDVDVDGSGRLYLAAWDGAGYKGSPKKGFIQQVTPKNWKYTPFPELGKLSQDALVKGLRSPSSTTRLHVSQEILRRAKPDSYGDAVLAIAKDSSASAESRVAAIFTYAQMMGSKGIDSLQELAKDASVRESALRAMADRKLIATSLDTAPFIAGIKDENPRVQVASAVALARIGKQSAAEALLSVSQPPAPDNNAAKSVAAPVYSSQPITGDQTLDIDVDINRIKDMYLIIESTDDDASQDFAAWFDPILVDDKGKESKLSKLINKATRKNPNPTKIQHPSSPKSELKMVNGKSASQGYAGKAFSVIHFKIAFEYVRLKATIGLTDKSKGQGSVRFVVSATAPILDDAKREGPHATPNSPIILPHIAVQSLVELEAIDASLAALDGDNQDGALWALRLMHDQKVVDGLIAKLNSTSDGKLQIKILSALARLYTREKAYDGSWWWGTQPDTRGPYYKPETWEASSKIETAYRSAYEKSSVAGKNQLAAIATKHRMNLKGIGKMEVVKKNTGKKVGDLSIEDVMLAFEKNKFDKANGKKVFAGMAACGACHNLKPEDPIKGPNLLTLGGHLTRDQIAEAILKPEATIADSWVDVTMKDGSTKHTGTLVSKTDTEVVIHNIAGIPMKLKMADVAKVAKADSTLMGPHLADQLSIKDFTDMVNYLQSLK